VTARAHPALDRAEEHLAAHEGMAAITALDAARADGLAVMGDPRWWRLRAEALGQVDLLDDAIENCERGLRLAPDDAVLLLTRCELLGRRGDLAEAEDDVRRVLEARPDDPSALVAYARLLSRAGDDAAARSVVSRALAIAPSDPAVLEASARVAAAAGEEAPGDGPRPGTPAGSGGAGVTAGAGS
jgi:tetratricopeptide (TPR) repeat protein